MKDFFRNEKGKDSENVTISLDGFEDKRISLDESVEFKPFLSKAKIAFIDSGFQEITEGIFLVKVFSGIWQENKKIHSLYAEFFFKTSDNEYRVISKEDQEFSKAIVKSIKKDNLVESIESGAIRYLLEILESGDVIVRDGSFDSDLFRDSLDESRKKQILLMGLSKSSSIKTQFGDIATEYLLEKLSGQCWYFKAFSDSSRDIVFVKLNELSNFCFRLDINKIPGLDLKHAIEIIASNAVDPSFIGYPYGLIDCDMNARVSNEECDFHHMKINVEYGIKLRKKREDAHNILDNIRF